jgi:hypothetical protein
LVSLWQSHIGNERGHEPNSFERMDAIICDRPERLWLANEASPSGKDVLTSIPLSPQRASTNERSVRLTQAIHSSCNFAPAPATFHTLR